jgi:cell division initiation protein
LRRIGARRNERGVVTISPVELRHLRFRRRPLGYHPAAVDAELGRVADAFELVWQERADLHDRVEELQAELGRMREIEDTLRRTLLSAERAADTVRAQARTEAEATLRDAEARARAIVGEAHAERERVRRDTLRLHSVEREFRARFRSVVASTAHMVDEYETELAESAS